MPSASRPMSTVSSRVPSLVLVLALCSTVAAAQAPLSKEFTPEESSGSYWTAERMREARPMPLPRIDPSAVEARPSREVGRGPSMEGPSAPPTRAPRSEDAVQLFETTDADAEIAAAWVALEAAEAGEASSADGRENVGTAGAHFSSSRVFPDAATTTYPYLVIGKLFFTQPGLGNFICSAAVISKRIVLTAGHCVHKGSGGLNGFFTNFSFVPAFRSGVAPVGTWTPAYVIVTAAWANGGGVVPNSGDFAVFEMNDQSGQRISFFTGHLGYFTNKLFPNHVHLLGYPANHDSGNRMHQVGSQSFKKLAPNTVQFGSDMRGGSSGGPWVQNFGVAAAGQTGGSNSSANRVVGVTSYGPTAVGPLYQGSSILDNTFANTGKTGLFDTACAHRAGNCT